MQNSCSFFFLRIKRSYLQIPENAWKFFLNKFTFNTVTFQVFFQGFYLDFKLLLLLHFKFPKPCIFQNNSFSHPFMVAGLGIHDNWLDERLWYYWYFTHFQGVWGCQNLRLKFGAWCLCGKIKSLTQHFAVGLF